MAKVKSKETKKSAAPAKTAVSKARQNVVKALVEKHEAEQAIINPVKAGNFSIKSGIATPPVSTKRENNYPFAMLTSGQSFLVPVEFDPMAYLTPIEANKALSELLGKARARIKAAIRRYKESRDKTAEFSVRNVTNGTEIGFDSDLGVGVWRD